MLLYCRDLLIYQQAPKLLESRAAYLTETFKQLAGSTPSDRLYVMIKILSETQNEIRFTNHANVYLSSDGEIGDTANVCYLQLVILQAIK